MRKLLLVTYHFPPSAASGSFRLLGFARHLPRFGWDVAVVAPPCTPYEPVDPALGARVPAETIVHSVPFPRGLTLKVLNRLGYGEEVWLPRARATCRRIVDNWRPDAVLTSGPPHAVHKIGIELKRRHGVPWAADFRDPWFSPLRPETPRGIADERAAITNCDALITNAPRAGEHYQTAFPEHAHKMVVITNGFDPELFPTSSPRSPDHGPIRIVHAGEIYLGRDPKPFLDALQRLIDTRPNLRGRLDARFLGRCHDGFQAEIDQRGLTQAVALPGQVPYAQTLNELAQADVLLLLDTPGRTSGVPAKLYEYLGANRPILALGEPDGDLAWVLQESGVPYRVAPTNDADAITRALTELLDVARGPAATSPGTADQRLRFARERLSQRLASVLESIAQPTSTNAASQGDQLDRSHATAVAARPANHDR